MPGLPGHLLFLVLKNYIVCMVKKFGLFIVLLFVSMASASGISWKTFDIKFGPSLGGWHDESTTMFGGMLSIVKPLTPYIGVGVMAEIATDASGCEDCVDYDFNELSEGILVNLIAPLGRGFSLTANFMFLVNFQDGTVEGYDFYAPKPIEAYDAEGNHIDVYRYMRETGDDDCGCESSGDYYFESFMFRSNLGISWRMQSNFFGLEFYPIDFAVVRGGDSRMTFSLNAVFRVF